MRLMVVIELLVVVAAASCACHLLSGSIAGLLSLGPLPSRALGGRRLMSSGFGALCPSRHRHEHSRRLLHAVRELAPIEVLRRRGSYAIVAPNTETHTNQTI